MINLTPDEKSDILRINSQYKMLHDKLDETEYHLKRLKTRQNITASLLDSNREDEVELINKLEEKYNIKLTSQMLMEILGIEMHNI